MAWPTVNPTNTHYNAGTDDPAQARVELVALFDAVILIIGSLGIASGVCDLDASAEVPNARLKTGPGNGINADMIDNYHAGNLTGQVPLSNGTECVNLLAQWASQWQTARNIALSGDASGNVDIDGSANVTLPITVTDDSHNHTITTLSVANSVSQSQLNQADSTVSLSIGGEDWEDLALTGGRWTISVFADGNNYLYEDSGSYYHHVYNNNVSSRTKNSYQRYIQASPPYMIGNISWGHFIYLLRRVSDGVVLGSYEAQDPIHAYNGDLSHHKDSIERIQSFPHPFLRYHDKDPADDGLEIVMVDCRAVNMDQWQKDVKRHKGCGSILKELDSRISIVSDTRAINHGLNIPGFTNRVRFVRASAK